MLTRKKTFTFKLTFKFSLAAEYKKCIKSRQYFPNFKSANLCPILYVDVCAKFHNCVGKILGGNISHKFKASSLLTNAFGDLCIHLVHILKQG